MKKVYYRWNKTLEKYCFVIDSFDEGNGFYLQLGHEEDFGERCFYIARLKVDERSTAQYLVDALSELKLKGYEFDEKTWEAFDWWRKKLDEERALEQSRKQERLRAFEQKAKEERAKVNYNYKQICEQNGCKTTITWCRKNCKYYWSIHCRPVLLKVKI